MNPIDNRGAAATAPHDDGAAPVAAADPGYIAKATKAALQFEGFFIAHMLHQMRAGTRAMAGEDSVFKDPVNSDMLDLADTLVADKMAGQRAFGIADAILRQLLPPAAPPAKPAGAAAAESLPAPLNRPA
ncbi:flagellar biosynthesis protein FlgJ [Janthinobacterium sp. CG_S6]|uniref:flagellar biosynthesis protein FlgJ n=1 Tax=Janthinobacterium sp. CG_S6 TaxID=3071707 RepID=UPI002E09AF06|nr:flagellar protein FlgJ [Janthinobacterium sp. CG_S6]